MMQNLKEDRSKQRLLENSVAITCLLVCNVYPYYKRIRCCNESVIYIFLTNPDVVVVGLLIISAPHLAV